MKIKIAGGSNELQLSEATFGTEYNEALVHQVVTASCRRHEPRPW